MPLENLSPYGHPKSTNDGGTVTRAAVTAATLTALKALVASDAARTHGNIVRVAADASVWYFHSSSALTADDVLVAAPAAGSGRWLRKPGAVCLEVPIAVATADNAVILTIPTGCAFKLNSAHWRITTAFSGGTGSALGVESSLNTSDGDILGGSGGDTTNVQSTGRRAGTVGTTMDSMSELHAQLYVAGDTFALDEITDAYLLGAGYVCLVGTLIANAGA